MPEPKAPGDAAFALGIVAETLDQRGLRGGCYGFAERWPRWCPGQRSARRRAADTRTRRAAAQEFGAAGNWELLTRLVMASGVSRK